MCRFDCIFFAAHFYIANKRDLIIDDSIIHIVTILIVCSGSHAEVGGLTCLMLQMRYCLHNDDVSHTRRILLTSLSSLYSNSKYI